MIHGASVYIFMRARYCYYYDRLAPIEHSEALKAYLEEINCPFKWLMKDKEGHGFYNEDSILESNQ